MVGLMQQAASGPSSSDSSGLSQRAAHITDRLKVLDRLTNESVALLDVLGNSLADLGRLTAPIHARATALTGAARNISATKAALDELLEHLDTSRRVAPILEAGPGRDLPGFLDALGLLEASNDFLTAHSDLAAVRAACEHSQAVFNRALEACDADFRASLAAGTRSGSAGGGAGGAAWLAAAREAFCETGDVSGALRDLLPPDQLPKLQREAALMLGAHFSPAQDGYVAARRAALAEALHEARLDIPPPPPAASGQQQLQLPPEQLARLLPSWGTQLTSVALLLLSEQRLADAIWPSQLAGQLFASLAQPPLASLAAIARAAAAATASGQPSHKGPADTLFVLLEMHAALARCLPLLRRMLAPSTQQQQQAAGRHSLTSGLLLAEHRSLSRRPSSPASTSSVLTGTSFFLDTTERRGSGRLTPQPSSPLRQQQSQAPPPPQQPGPGDALLQQLQDVAGVLAAAARRAYAAYEAALAACNSPRTAAGGGGGGGGGSAAASSIAAALRVPLPADGTIHPLTAQVVSFAKRLLAKPNAARVLCGGSSSRSDARGGPADDSDGGSSDDGDNDDADDDDGFTTHHQAQQQAPPKRLSRAQRALSLSVQRLLGVLLDVLRAKAAAGYRPHASSSSFASSSSSPLAALFVMNNGHYVVSSLEGSDRAAALLGAEWLEARKDDVEEAGAAYHDASWMPLVRLLQAELPSEPSRLKLALKETYSQFNTAIDSIYATQSAWSVPDGVLRSAVKRVIKDDVLPPYQDFLRRHADVEFTSNPAKYIRYAAADIGALVDDDLLTGRPVGGSSAHTYGAGGGSSKLRDLHKEKLGALM